MLKQQKLTDIVIIKENKTYRPMGIHFMSCMSILPAKSIIPQIYNNAKKISLIPQIFFKQPYYN
jgi:hypothetical protein